MFHFPEFSDPGFQSFLVGFLIPFLSAASGFAIASVRSILKKMDRTE